MKYAIGAGAVFAILIVALLVFIYSGEYSVAATQPHTGLTRWALNTVMERSVRDHAREIEVPPLTDSAQIRNGFHHFDAMCVVCHGAPGESPSEIGEGLNPNPPELSEVVPEWSSAELYWIVKHGIKMSGMPAFGPTHSDDDLWAIVAFLRRLPGISPAQYQSIRAAYGSGGHAHGGEDEHEH
ncbi:MAG TPA: cytochrome c [Longimicrobiaceae bacterium]|nr:cytochrome c [Longimicrobiaceae bacterium]